MTIKELEQRIFSIPPHVDSEQMVVVLGYNDYQELDQEVKMQATYPNHVQQDHLKYGGWTIRQIEYGHPSWGFMVMPRDQYNGIVAAIRHSKAFPAQP